MQLLVRTESSQGSTNTAQTKPSAKLPYSKAYRQQSHLLRELELQQANRDSLQQALARKKTHLSLVALDSSTHGSAKLLAQQVQSIEYEVQNCEEAIATLRSRLALNMIDRGELSEDEDHFINTSVLSATSDVFDFALDRSTSSAFAPAAAYRAVLDQELAEELGSIDLNTTVDDAGDEHPSFVPAVGWESILGTWV